jgi:type VI secretion system protein
MTLNLIITNVEKLENGVSTRLRLDRHGAVIGRSPQADWSLPDPQHFISSTHCEIDFRNGLYVLVDRSTNGTFVNAATERLARPHTLRDGDEITLGHYIVKVKLEGEAALASPPDTGQPAWSGWDSHAGGAVAAPAAGGSAWDAPAPKAAISGMGPMSAHWAAPAVEAPPPPASSVWGQVEAAAPAQSASDWSSPVQDPPDQPSAVDVWGKLAEGNSLDWSRAGFGSRPAEALVPVKPAGDPFGLASPSGSPASEPFGRPAPAPSFQDVAPSIASAPASREATSVGAGSWGAPATAAPAAAPWGAPAVASPTPTPAAAPSWGVPVVASPPAAAMPGPAPVAAPPAGGGGEWQAFVRGAGIAAADVKGDPVSALSAAGDLLRRFVGGMVTMLEARARAKAQLGAQSTALEFDGNNPLKFARSPERALAQLLGPPERGFMSADRAIEDAFRDLQAHQMATLAAMQGALAATLARFSPTSIRERAAMRGLLAKIVPSARDAELWKAYEREFEGVARGSDEAFMDIFAKEFKQAYERVSAEMKARR